MLTNHSINLISIDLVNVVLQRLDLTTKIVREGHRIEIVVTQPSGRKLTISVRTGNHEYGWFFDDPVKCPSRPNHFVVLLDFDGKFSDPTVTPKTWVVPYAKCVELVEVRPMNQGRMCRIPHDMVVKLADFINNWELLTEEHSTASGTAADEQASV